MRGKAKHAPRVGRDARHFYAVPRDRLPLSRALTTLPFLRLLVPFCTRSSLSLSRSYGRIRPCKLVELGYSPGLQRRGTVPKPPGVDVLRDLVSPARDSAGAASASPRSTKAGAHPAGPPAAEKAALGAVQRTLFASVDDFEASGSPPGRPSQNPKPPKIEDLEVDSMKLADQAYKDAKAALRMGSVGDALTLLDRAYTNCPEQYSVAREKIFQLRTLAASQVEWSTNE